MVGSLPVPVHGPLGLSKAGNTVEFEAPPALGAEDLDPPTIRSAFYKTANLLETIPGLWIEGDNVMSDLASRGLGTETGGFERLARDARDPIDEVLDEVRGKILPFILPHADLSLRLTVLELLGRLDWDLYIPDDQAGGSERWRQSWMLTGLQPGIETVVQLLRAAGDSVLDAAGESPKGEVGSGRVETAQDEATAEGAARTRGTNLTEDEIALALTIIAMNPTINWRELGKRVGRPHSTLASNKRIREFKDSAMSAAAGEVRKGFLVEDDGLTDVEAIDPDHPNIFEEDG